MLLYCIVCFSAQLYHVVEASVESMLPTAWGISCPHEVVRSIYDVSQTICILNWYYRSKALLRFCTIQKPSSFQTDTHYILYCSQISLYVDQKYVNVNCNLVTLLRGGLGSIYPGPSRTQSHLSPYHRNGRWQASTISGPPPRGRGCPISSLTTVVVSHQQRVQYYHIYTICNYFVVSKMVSCIYLNWFVSTKARPSGRTRIVSLNWLVVYT